MWGGAMLDEIKGASIYRGEERRGERGQRWDERTEASDVRVIRVRRVDWIACRGSGGEREGGRRRMDAWGS